ncbi:tumor necrosis factor receptor superfamily member 3 [Dendropsophus ebraccatus]|uniref:tumor necrosis factor receptor superfamily member 3 n=1 Tax=Dendropsophus ebraccatus TaxID=150705 RepID=UPI0038314D90
MDLPPCPRLVLLCLGIISWNLRQVVAVSCNRTQYVNEEYDICCSRCRPGYYRKAHCTPTNDTQCLPCASGQYATKWNYAESCRTCYPCRLTLVEKTPCSATQAAVCVCADGFHCIQKNAMGECDICIPNVDTVSTVADEIERLPDDDTGIDIRTFWIITGVALFILVTIVVVLCLKTSLLKRFGRMIKNKNCSDSTSTQIETPVTVEMAGATISLLKKKTTKMPMQEQGKDLNFPIQETSNEIGESTLISKEMSDICPIQRTP